MTDPLTLPPPDTEIEGMRRCITALVHQLGGSACIDKPELERIILEGWTVQVQNDGNDNYILREVQA